MLSAGNGLKVSCGDANDVKTREIAGISVSKALMGRFRVFTKRSRLRRKKKHVLDQFRRNPGSKELLFKLLRGVSWERLDRGYQKMFSLNLRGTSVARWIAKRYNSHKINSVQVATVWRQVFQNRPNTRQCSANPSAPATRPVTPTRPRPAGKQQALQNALVEAVRKVYGASKSESYAVTILKTQKWSTLKALGITTHLMKAFRKLGYRRAAKIPRVARRLLKKTLRNWKKSSSTVQPPLPQRVPSPRPAPRPARPAPAPIRPRPRPAGNQLALQNALVASVRKVYGASKSESYAVTILKTQKWSTLKQLGVVSHIQAAFRKLGYRKAGRDSHRAQRLVKKVLKSWKKSP